jgi:methyltransferase FkbM-like protein
MAELDLHPVLLDIGASGKPPEIWDEIARHSTYVGFDPDLREMREISNGRYEKAIVINEAVTCNPDRDEVLFYLTKFPYCSSTIRPDAQSLSKFLFADFFTVEKEVNVRASTLDEVLERLGLSRIDWFKTDSQGTDLRLFNSLKDDIRARVLAVDLEPGLINAYLGEDLFVDVHRDLMQKGFWLSDLKLCGAVRMGQAAVKELISRYPNLQPETIESSVKASPGWVEARYLRTLDWLVEYNLGQREYAVLWVFALLDNQAGFALDVGIAYENVFGVDGVSNLMKSEASREIEAASRSLRAAVMKSVPARAIRRLKRSLQSQFV